MDKLRKKRVGELKSMRSTRVNTHTHNHTLTKCITPTTGNYNIQTKDK